MDEPIGFLSAVLVVSENPKRLADLYRDVVDVPNMRSTSASRVNLRCEGDVRDDRRAGGARRLRRA